MSGLGLLGYLASQRIATEIGLASVIILIKHRVAFLKERTHSFLRVGRASVF